MFKADEAEAAAADHAKGRRRLGCFSGCLTLVAIVFVVNVFTDIKARVFHPPTPTPAPPNPTPTPDPFTKMTSLEHLSEAKVRVQTWKYESAKRHLAAIPATAAESKEAMRLRKDIERAEEADRVETEKAARVTGAKNRKAKAGEMETLFLRQGIDMKARVGGPFNTTLTFEWILISRPWVFKFYGDSPEMQKTFRDAGFKKIVFTDGHDFGVSYTSE